MSEIKLKFEIEADDDGYISFECPFCESIFSLSAGEFQSEDNIFNELYCPYCGLVDEPNNFYTKEVIEQAQNLAINYIYDEINKAFAKMSKNINGKYVKMTYKPLKNKKISKLKTEESNDVIFECKNCNNHIKVNYCIGESKIYCSYCGVDIC